MVNTRFPACGLAAIGMALALLLMPSSLRAQTLRLKDGRIVRGAVAATAGIAENPNSPSPQAGEIAVQPIYVIDDQLRRLFISKQQVVEVLNQAPEQIVRISLWQDVATTGGHVSSIGPSLGISPFDQFGRRVYEMQTKTGPLAVVQGITEITPRYAKVEALRGSQPRDVAWDMRLATSSIPPDTLAQIFARHVPRDDPQARLQVVRFYVDAERFTRARPELEQILIDFPELKDLDAEVRKLRQLGAQRILRELQMRRTAGQHRLVHAMLEGFPAEHVDGETLAEVRELISQYARIDQRLETVRTRLAAAVEAIADADDRGLVSPLAAEIVRDLSRNNVDRLAPFAQLADDASLSPEQKAALALTGWLLGPDSAQDDLAIAIAMGKLRTAVLAYLEQPVDHERQAVLDEVRTLAGASIENLAALVAHMKPPRHQRQFVDDPHGTWLLTAPGVTEDGDFRYRVQLPPEYDPYRRYPTLVVLNGAYNSVKQELDFWAGSPPPGDDDGLPGRRNGQAARHGYIVLAVEWLKPQQYVYEHSAREHLAVLTSLRNATRRFSIDTDRVYLSGHGVGADAIWDIAQAHPDLWAGVVPFNGRGDMYVPFYWENAKYAPWYFVAGEKDGASIKHNAPLWDRYVKKLGFDATVVEYQGRGHEPFHDEILNALDWMSRRSRKGPPEAFECRAMRPWDNFFWWIECRDFDDKWMIHPAEFEDRRKTHAQVEGRIRKNNRVYVKTVANAATIWLNPDVVEFGKPVQLFVNNNKQRMSRDGIEGDPAVLLEDVRTRGDRQRPFWAKVEWPLD